MLLIHFSKAFLNFRYVTTKKRICARSIILSVQHVLQTCWLPALMETESITVFASQNGGIGIIQMFILGLCNKMLKKTQLIQIVALRVVLE